MKLEETNSKSIVGKNVTSNGVSKSSSFKQEQIISSAKSTSTSVTKNITHKEQTQQSTEMFQQNGSNGSIKNGNSVLKVHHATMESVGHEFHQASSMQSVQQTGYDGVSLFGGSRKTSSNGQANTISNGRQHSDSKENIISCPMELPEVKPLSLTYNDLQNGNSTAPSERKEENNIASEYFQTKFGSDSSAKKKAPVVSKQALVNEINCSIAMKKPSRESSVGVQQEKQGGLRSRSKTTTPERGSRSSSISKQNGGDFSYLSLLPDDGTYPHRTHPIGNPQTSRRNSVQKGDTGKMSRAGSTDHLNINKTEKKNFMVRSNPIGLAEPSIKRDGYAVGKDGSFYRSSEHLFENKVSQSNSRASSEAPEGNWRDRRRSSTSSGSGIRVGGGLVEPKAPSHGNSFMMPFGAAAVKPANFVNLLKSSKSRSKSQQRSSSKETKSNKLSMSEITIKQNTTKHNFSIKTGTQEIQSLTSALNQKSSTKTSTETTTMNFKEVDVRQQKKEEHNISFTVNKPIQRRARHDSLSKKQSSLPDQSVTISLPGSRRISRTASVDRIDVVPENGLKKSNRSSSQEIFTGEYKMKIPSAKPTPAKESSTKCILKMTAKVEEICADTVVMKANCDELEEAHTEATIKVPKNPVPPPPPPPATKDAPELQLVQVTVTPQNRPNKSGFTLCSKNQLIENHALVTKDQFSLNASTSSRSAQESSSLMTSSTVAASKSTKLESVSQKQTKTETVMTQKLEQSSSTTQSMTTSTNVSNCTQVEGQKFNIAKPLKRTSHHGSKDNLSIANTHRSRSKLASGTNESSSKRIETKSTVSQESKSNIGGHLKGLDVALEALAKQQKEQEIKELKLTQNTQKSMLITQQHTTKDGTTSVTVSLPPSRRGSRRGSISEGGGQIRSRKNSMDLYSANYNVRLSRQGSPTRLQQKSACHIRVDDKNSSKIKLCPRCHAPDHDVQSCADFGGLMCPRCMEWDHWEDTCWTNLTSDDRLECLSCSQLGHSSSVHDATDYKQRRAIVDTLGWQNFKEWFYEGDFRSWWQMNGCVGVPLYKLYKRNTEWKDKVEKPEIDTSSSNENSGPSNMSIEERASLLAAKYSSKYDRSKLAAKEDGSKLKREDSTDDLMKSIALANSRRAKRIEDMMKNEDNDDVLNGNANNNTTTDELPKYSNSDPISNNVDGVNNKKVVPSCDGDTTSKRLRTFSETLKMLDDDIVADLNVKCDHFSCGVSCTKQPI